MPSPTGEPDALSSRREQLRLTRPELLRHLRLPHLRLSSNKIASLVPPYGCCTLLFNLCRRDHIITLF